jgi:hypothetical protein
VLSIEELRACNDADIWVMSGPMDVRQAVLQPPPMSILRDRPGSLFNRSCASLTVGSSRMRATIASFVSLCIFSDRIWPAETLYRNCLRGRSMRPGSSATGEEFTGLRETQAFISGVSGPPESEDGTPCEDITACERQAVVVLLFPTVWRTSNPSNCGCP